MTKNSRQLDVIWESELEEPPDLSMEPFFDELCQCLELGHVEMSVLITGDERIRELNAAYRGKDKATDVLSFPNSAPAIADRSHHLGDIVISAETAARQAEEIGQDTSVELRFLCLHGTLHLIGYDHETDDGQMLAFQSELKTRLQHYF